MALLLGLAGTAEPVLSVPEVRRVLPGSRGRVVVVRGRLSNQCGSLSCSLEAVEPIADRTLMANALSVSRVDAVEPLLIARRGQVVTMRVRLGRPLVFEENGQILVQTDRAEELIPIALEE